MELTHKSFTFHLLLDVDIELLFWWWWACVCESHLVCSICVVVVLVRYTAVFILYMVSTCNKKKKVKGHTIKWFQTKSQLYTIYNIKTFKGKAHIWQKWISQEKMRPQQQYDTKTNTSIRQKNTIISVIKFYSFNGAIICCIACVYKCARVYSYKCTMNNETQRM